jgi:hypothetical protein
MTDQHQQLLALCMRLLMRLLTGGSLDKIVVLVTE